MPRAKRDIRGSAGEAVVGFPFRKGVDGSEEVFQSGSIKETLLIVALALAASAAGRELELPEFSGSPSPGKRTIITVPEYVGTDVHHVMYLPPDWTPEMESPVIVEYTGNFAPQLGSTGLVKDAALGFGLSGGECIWLVLPYVGEDGKSNERTWWGDVEATVAYAKTNVPRVCKEFGGDPDRVVVCGFSRGAIGVNFIGLHDDEIARLWCGFFTHDHYDGVKEWRGTDWGAPLVKYRREALERLKRIDGRPVMVSQNRTAGVTRDYLAEIVPLVNFDFLSVPVEKILGEFPNGTAIHPHTDRWMFRDSEQRDRARAWFEAAIAGGGVSPVHEP